jgi:hypothetical protein
MERCINVTNGGFRRTPVLEKAEESCLSSRLRSIAAGDGGHPAFGNTAVASDGYSLPIQVPPYMEPKAPARPPSPGLLPTRSVPSFSRTESQLTSVAACVESFP